MSSKLSIKTRLEILQRARNGESITKICKECTISRTLFYRWLKRYKNAHPNQKATVLKPKTPKHKRRTLQVPPHIEALVLEIASLRPNFGPEKISEALRKKGKLLSSHGVYNVLVRFNLNTAEKRKKTTLRLYTQSNLLYPSATNASTNEGVPPLLRSDKKAYFQSAWLPLFAVLLIFSSLGIVTSEHLSGFFNSELENIVKNLKLHTHPIEKIALTSDYLLDLDGSELENIDASRLAGLPANSFLRSDQASSAESAITFTAKPSSADVSGGSLYINPQEAPGNNTLFGIALDDASRFRIDAEGDVSIAGSLTVDNGFTLSSGTFSLPDNYVTDAMLSNDLTLDSTKKIQTTLTTEQMRLRYNSANYLTLTVGSSGAITLDATGDGAAFTISDALTASSTLTVSGTSITASSASLTLGGSISGATTIESSGNINTTGGVIQTNSVTRIDNSGNLSVASATITGGITAGSGSVGIIDSSGRIPEISSTYFASLTGDNLTNIPQSAVTNLVSDLDSKSTVIWKTDPVTVIDDGADSDYADIDVTSDTSSDASGIFIRATNNSGLTSINLFLRENGSTDTGVSMSLGASETQMGFVALDSGQIFEYKVSTNNVDVEIIAYSE